MALKKVDWWRVAVNRLPPPVSPRYAFVKSNITCSREIFNLRLFFFPFFNRSITFAGGWYIFGWKFKLGKLGSISTEKFSVANLVNGESGDNLIPVFIPWHRCRW